MKFTSVQFSVAHHFVSLLDRCPLQIMVHYFSLNNDNLLKFIHQLVTNEFLVAKFYSYLQFVNTIAKIICT